MAKATTLLLFLFATVVYGELQLQTRYPTVAAEVGERCIVCGMPLSSNDTAIILRGRRIPVMKGMADTVLKNPEIYFKSVQARGALFQEDFQGQSGAVSKGLAPISGFCLGFGLSVFGYLYVLTRPSQTTSLDIPAGLAKVPVTQSPLACPQCGNTNHPAAASCAVCHVALSPQGHSDLSCTR
jgi:hypothetical protein